MDTRRLTDAEIDCPGCGQRNCPNPQIGEYFDGVDERPVAPAPTASASMIRDFYCETFEVEPDEVDFDSTEPVFCRGEVLEFAEAYASSQPSKLEGVGQEAAEKLSIVPRRQAEIASIIDELIAGRLKP